MRKARFFLLVVRILQLKKRKLIYNTIITARFRGGGGGGGGGGGVLPTPTPLGSVSGYIAFAQFIV